MFATENLSLVLIDYVYSKDWQTYVMPIGKKAINCSRNCGDIRLGHGVDRSIQGRSMKVSARCQKECAENEKGAHGGP